MSKDNPNHSTPHLMTTWHCYSQEKDTVRNMKEIDADQDKVKLVVHEQALTELLQQTAQSDMPEHIIIDLDGVEAPIEFVNELKGRLNKTTTLLAIGSENDIPHYKALKQQGVDEYLIKPIQKFKLLQAIDHILTPDDTSLTDSICPMTTVIGSRGGIGSSTIAANLSWLVSQQQGAKTCLIDLDFYFGDTTVALNVVTNNGLAQALMNAHRLDGVLLEQLAQPALENLDILSTELSLDESLNYSNDAFENLTDLIRSEYEQCIIDVPHGLDLRMTPVFRASERIILVADMSIVSVRDSARLISRIRQKAPQADIDLLVIRIPQAREAEVSRAEFERAVDHPVEYVLPFDRYQTLSALNQGTPLVSKKPHHKITRALSELANVIHPNDEPTVPQTWWQKVFSSKRTSI